MIWRIYPFRPARRAAAGVFRRLGVLAADLSALLAERAARHGADWAAHARAHRRYVRDGIEEARTLRAGHDPCAAARAARAATRC